MKRKIGLLLIILLILSAGALVFYKVKYSKKEEKPTNVAKVIDSIPEYGYNIEDRDTELFKTNFTELKNILSKSEIDYEEYTNLLAKLFVIDFYTLNTKINKYDVGGTEFLKSNMLENFKLKAEDTIYKYLEDNSYNKRKQELPEVSSIEIQKTEDSMYSIDKQAVPSTELLLKWSYVKDLGYDNQIVLTFVREDNKVVLVDVKSISKAS